MNINMISDIDSGDRKYSNDIDIDINADKSHSDNGNMVITMKIIFIMTLHMRITTERTQ